MRRPRRPSGDEGVALLFVVMAMLVLASLSVLTLGAIISQVGPTQYQRKANLTINAAQAGLNTGLAAIREATYEESGTTYGDRSKLPCWNAQAGSIPAPQGGSTLTFSVSIQYFANDPSGQTQLWRTLNALPCVPGVGTFVTPAFAQITAVAAGPGLLDLPASSGNRTLQGTYTFSLTNPNLPGGLIRDANGLCYSGGALPGTVVRMATCAIGADEQMWMYNSNFQLVLASTRAADGTGGMCLGATPLTPSSNPVTAVMKLCDATDFSQRWGVNGNNPVHFFGHLNGVYAKTWCLGATTPGSTGSTVAADTGTCATANRGVYPQAAVGAGAAGTLVKTTAEVDGKPLQWVNYQEFGRCMDINGWSLTASIHIVYPCKQDPMVGVTSAASPGWNEVFTWSSSSLFFYANAANATGKPSDPSDPAYCMKSPNRVGGYVTFSTRCTSVTAATRAAYQWTVNRDTGNYATSYTIVDYYGRCLSNGPATGSYSSVITNTCDGSEGQKWNAPPGFGNANLASVLEVFPTP